MTEMIKIEEGMKINGVGVYAAVKVDRTWKRIVLDEVKNETVNCDTRGHGQKFVCSGKAENIGATLTYTAFDRYPGMCFIRGEFENTGKEDMILEAYRLADAEIEGEKDATRFWMYSGASYVHRPDWILPLADGFERSNFMGMNDVDYGGGTPVVDLWTRDFGFAVGSAEQRQYEISLPVSVSSGRARIAFEHEVMKELAPGEKTVSIEAFVLTHTGDCFESLREYRGMLIDGGLKFEPISDTAFEPTWCAWGYGRTCTQQQVFDTLPKVRDLGIKWACLDDGYATAYGSLVLDPEKYPNGDADMRAYTDRLHAEGMKAQIWWAPLAVHPNADSYQEHPEWLIINKEGKHQPISFWDSFYQCAAYGPVIEEIKSQLRTMLVDWNFDGVKIDGQFLNSAPACYNPEHHHASPDDSIVAMTEIMKTIYDLAREIKPDATVLYCPCGTAYTIFTMPYYNMPIASDPRSSWQIRSKGKVIRALAGDGVAYHGDHIELSDGESDFPSVVGIGAIIDSKFVWPRLEGQSLNGGDHPTLLDDEREKLFRKWLTIAEKADLPRGIYHGELYDIGFDRPEAYAIERRGEMYYSFYADKFEGEIEIRGLDKNASYDIFDYENEVRLGGVTGENAKLNVKFNGHLLVVAKKK